MKLSLIRELQNWIDKVDDINVSIAIEGNYVYIRFVDVERKDKFSIGFEIDLTDEEELN